MRRFHLAASVALLVACAIPAKADTRYMTVVNRAYDSVVSLATAPANSGDFREIPLDAPLHGGGGAETVQIAAEGCRYDFRIRLRDGRTRIYAGVDVCRYNRMYLRPLRR